MIILSFLAAVLLHECGHLFALTLFRARISSARLSLFGITLIHTKLPSPLYDLAVAAAGPLFGIFGYIVTQNSCYFPVFPSISITLSLFNLLPIATLDGARILNALLCLRLDPIKAESLGRAVSKITLLFLWLIGAYLFLFQNSSPSLFLMALTLFFEGIKLET